MIFLRASRAPFQRRVSSQSTAGKASFIKQLGRFVVIARPEFKIVGIAIGLLIVSSTVSMSVPFSMGAVIDIVMENSRRKDGQAIENQGTDQQVQTIGQSSKTLRDKIKSIGSLNQIFGTLISIFIVGALANTGRNILMKSASERIITRLRTTLYSRLLRQDISFHDANRSGELISRLSTDTVIVSKSLTNNVSDGLRALVVTTVGIGAMVYVNLELTLTMMMIVPPISAGAVIYGRYLRKISEITTDASADLTKIADEKLSNIRTVRSFAQEANEMKRYNDQAEVVYQYGMKEAYASGIFYGAAGLAGNLTIISLLYYGGMMVQIGTITVGELTSFFLYTAYVGSSLMGLSSWWAELNKGVGASTRIFGLIDGESKIEPNNDSCAENGKRPENLAAKLRFDNVCFAYPSRPDTMVLNNLTFEISEGQTVAIVGSSGSGKSTIAHLLLRFYEPKSGCIFVGDYAIKDLDPVWMRETQMGLVSQEPVLFADTIFENIRYGKPQSTIKEVVECSQRSNSHQFISDFPKGYETLAGDRGASLSGGQRQRISIARALLKNPKILVMDEASSALDSTSEYLVGKALEEIIKHRTTITIAHRLSTIKKADVILVLKDGRMVEKGTFSELISIEDGVFSELISKQLSAP